MIGHIHMSTMYNVSETYRSWVLIDQMSAMYLESTEVGVFADQTSVSSLDPIEAKSLYHISATYQYLQKVMCQQSIYSSSHW